MGPDQPKRHRTRKIDSARQLTGPHYAGRHGAELLADPCVREAYLGDGVSS